MKKSFWFILFIVVCCCANAKSTTDPIQINMTGLTGKPLENVQQRLAISKSRMTDVTPIAVQNFYEQAPKEIEAALAPYGYFKPRVNTQIAQQGDRWIMNFQVDPGPPLPITQIDLQITGEGKADPVLQKILAKLPIRAGQTFNNERYEKTKELLFTTANVQGYLTAKMLQSQVNINLQAYSAAITLHFDTGPRFRFGKVHFHDNALSDEFLRRYQTFQEGDYYSPTKLSQFQQALSDSNYFENVFIKPKIDRAENLKVPVSVNLKPRKSQQYNLGIGYGTDTGLRGLLGVELRRVNRKGHYFNTQLQVSQIYNALEANYVIPGEKPATEKYMLSALVGRENQTNGDGDVQKVSASYIKAVHGWQQTLALSLQNERYKLFNLPAQKAIMLIPSASWMRIQRDNELRPSKGYRIDVTLQGANSALLSNINFLQAQASVKTLHKLSKRNRLLLRGQVAYTAIKDITKLPLSLQLFAGGSESVRGYGYNTIGPGKALLVASAEYRYKVKGNWYAATFIDAGNVSQSFTDKLEKGVGVGVVWQSPVGALELTVARALDYPGQPLSLQFSMGPDL